MAPKLSINIYKSADYLLLTLPIIIILGSPSVNLILSVYSILFLYLSIKYSFWSWLKINWVIIAATFWIYLIVLSFFSLDLESSLRASFFFVRFILFALFIEYFSFKYLNYKKIFKIWFYIILFVCVDIWIQFIFGTDLFGYKDHGTRFAGLFGDELVAGSFLWKICGPIVGFIFYERFLKKNIKYNYSILALSLIPITILITGERASFIMFSFYFLLSLFFLSFSLKKIKFLMISVLLIVALFISAISFSNSVQNRYNDMLKITKNFSHSSYGVLFDSGILIWKKNLFTGVGLKNFSVVCDKTIKSKYKKFKHPPCSTHPHNLYIQILSETGLLGLIFFISLFSIFFHHILKNFYFTNKNKIEKYIFITSCASLLSLLWPFITSGSFYSSWNGIFYWMLIGILLNLSKKLN